MTKKEQRYEEKIAKLEQKVKDLEESRVNSLESCRLSLKKNRIAREEAETGMRQIRELCNSILTYVAMQNGGEIKLPMNHLELTKGWTYRMIGNLPAREYILKVEEEKK